MHNTLMLISWIIHLADAWTMNILDVRQ